MARRRGARPFTTRIAEWALCPFALCIAIDVFIVIEKQFGRPAAAGFGAFFGLLALFFWYWLEAVMRRRTKEEGQVTGISFAPPEPERRHTPISEKITTMLTEARVVLPGVQVLLGFQFSVVLTDSFDRLPVSSKLIHALCLGFLGLSVILLIAPAAYHRIVAEGEDRPDVHRFGVGAVLAAMLPLAFALSGDLYIVLARITQSTALSVATAVLALLTFAAFWLFYPLWARRQARPPH